MDIGCNTDFARFATLPQLRREAERFHVSVTDYLVCFEQFRGWNFIDRFYQGSYGQEISLINRVKDITKSIDGKTCSGIWGK